MTEETATGTPVGDLRPEDPRAAVTRAVMKAMESVYGNEPVACVVVWCAVGSGVHCTSNLSPGPMMGLLADAISNVSRRQLVAAGSIDTKAPAGLPSGPEATGAVREESPDAGAPRSG
jgi:hypothetical protein